MAHPTKTQAITSLLMSASIREAAKKSGIPERTLTRWMTLPEFVQALREAESQVLRDSVRALAGDMELNLSTMRFIRDDEDIPVNIRLRAAVVIDEAHRRWREIQDLDERISSLEAKYASET